MRWRSGKRLLWLIAASATAYGFVQFGLPTFYEWQRYNSYRETVLTKSLEICKEIRVANLRTHAIPIPRGGDLPANKIDAFCNCTKEGDANSITKDEWQYLRLHRDILPSMKIKQEATFQKCLADAR
jgi:hypothetical protein